MIRVFKVIWRLLVRLFICAVVFVLFLWPLARGWWLHHTLASALSDAASVQVVEHSSPYDDHRFGIDYQPVTYATVTLNPEQVQALRRALPVRLDYSEAVALGCIFEEHHYIKIVRKDGSILVLHICFQCGEIVVNDKPIDLGDTYDTRIMPVGWYGRLDKFIDSLGLHPHGPWPPPGHD